MRKIAIVGANTHIRKLAPYDDKSWEIWTFSPFNHEMLPRFDRWFELHCPFKQSLQLFPRYHQFLRETKGVTVRDRDCGLPDPVMYPEREMLDRFGPFFFTSSAAWLMALAISERPAKLGIWIASYHKGDPYEHQLPGVQYFVQKAREAGVEIVCPAESKAVTPTIYGGKSNLGEAA